MAHKHYKKSPIIEAVFAIEFQDNARLPILDFYNQVSKDFPNKEETFSYQLLKEETVSEPTFQKVTNLRLWAEDKKKLLQISPEFFVFNKLSPYPGWEGFFPDIEKFLKLYYDFFNPSKIKKIFLNYTNKFEFDSINCVLSEYFNLDYNILSGKIKIFKDIMLGFRINPTDQEEMKVQLFNYADEKENKTTFVLDLEIYTLACKDNTFDSVLIWLKSNHELLYQSFEDILKSKTKELIK
jgi:uncharacterized protein (TIGR04255 family)